jgi:hypothetical protein
MKPQHNHPPSSNEMARFWWESRMFAASMVLITTLPLLWPDVPPLTDLTGHMGRYKIQIDLENSEHLRRFYGFDWALIGNLGVDLLVVPFAKLLGLELAVKLIVVSIPALTVAGFLWVAREVHGCIPPTALFALPFAYGHPFIFGFVNFALSMAFAFLAFGLWLRLARFGHFQIRAALFVPISLIIWVTHIFGWGALGLMCFSAEAVRQHDKGRGFVEAAFRAGVHCLSMAPPILLMLAWRSGGVGGITTDYLNWKSKWLWIISALRDRWKIFDIVSLIVVGLVLLEALRNRKVEYSRNLAASAIVLLLMFALLPRIIFGSAYADMRLVPYMMAVAVLAIRFRPGVSLRYTKILLAAGLAFFLVRTAATTVSFWMFDRTYDRELKALDHVPQGAPMVSLVGEICGNRWRMSRLHHLPGLAIVRREAFSNEQWVMAGAQLLRVHFHEGLPFVRDPSQIVVPKKCKGEPYRSINQALAQIPRNAFDYVWIINSPQVEEGLTKGLRPVWRSGRSVLFKVER